MPDAVSASRTGIQGGAGARPPTPASTAVQRPDAVYPAPAAPGSIQPIQTDPNAIPEQRIPRGPAPPNDLPLSPKSQCSTMSSESSATVELSRRATMPAPASQDPNRLGVLGPKELRGVRATGLEHLLVYTPVSAAHPLNMEVPMRAAFNKRPVKLVIGITIYSEDGSELQRSLAAVMKNIEQLERLPEAHRVRRDEVLVVCVMDGVDNVSHTMTTYLNRLFEGREFYNSGLAASGASYDVFFSDSGDGPQAQPRMGDSPLRRRFADNRIVSHSAPDYQPAVHGAPAPPPRFTPAEALRTGVSAGEGPGAGPGHDLQSAILRESIHSDGPPRVSLSKLLSEHAGYADDIGHPVSVHMLEWIAKIRVDTASANAKAHADTLNTDSRLPDGTCATRASMDLERARAMEAGAPGYVVDGASADHTKSISPLQLAVMVKQHNAGKISSHSWLFQAACRQLQPKYVLMLDVGTAPSPKSLAALVSHMEEHPNVGGATGEICVGEVNYCDPLMASQHVDYRVGQQLDKALEHMFGYVSVLPGAFALYRWQAIDGSPLRAYFQMEDVGPARLSPFAANMYLAEDRILAFELLAKRGSQYYLAWEPKAKAYTDVPSNLSELLRQRRRWSNGGFFAWMYYVGHAFRFCGSQHSPARKLVLFLQLLHNLVTASFVWFNIGVLYIALTIIYTRFFRIMFDTNGVLADSDGQLYVWIFHGVAATTIVAVLLNSLLLNVRKHTWPFTLAACVLGLLSVGAFGLGVYLFLQGDTSGLLVTAAALAGVGTLVLGALLHGQFFSTIIPLPWYLFFFPTYTLIFPMYSFARVNDVSWGLKDSGNRANARRALEAQAAVQRSSLHASQSTLEDVERAAGLDEAAALNAAVPPSRFGERGSASRLADSMASAPTMTAEQLRQARDALNEPSKHDQAIQSKRFRKFRDRLLAAWLFCNLALIGTVIALDLLSEFALILAIGILYMSAIRLLGVIAFVGSRCCVRGFRGCCRPRLAARVSRQHDNVCYKLDKLTGKLRCCCHRQAYFMTDWAWQVTHDLIEPSRCKHVHRNTEKRLLSDAKRLAERNNSVLCRRAAGAAGPIPGTSSILGGEPELRGQHAAVRVQSRIPEHQRAHM